jgi:gamma-glutamyl-gamma-aminobutyrate hydrolase PuuD
VFVLPGAFSGQIVLMMARAGCVKASSVEESDLIIFSGGTDVDPSMYGARAIPETMCTDIKRDEREKAVFERAVELKIPMFGICRGAQFLQAMNKGELWQHVEGHCVPHDIYDVDFDYLVRATSMHHQALMLNDRMELIAVAREQVSSVFKSADMFIDLKKEGANADIEVEIEAASYDDTMCLMIQGHPEVGTPEYTSWTLHTLMDKMSDWDIDFKTWKKIPDEQRVEVTDLREGKSIANIKDIVKRMIG